MHRIDNSTAVAVMPTRQPTGTVGFFSQGSQTAGQLATIVGPDILNAIMMEIANVITNAGITLSKTNDAQLWQAINALINAARLGFVPVEQGGGTLQGTNKVHIGWGADGSGLRAQIDAYDAGPLAFRLIEQNWGAPQHFLAITATDVSSTGNVNANGGSVYAGLDVTAGRSMSASVDVYAGRNLSVTALATAGGLHSTGDLNVDGNQHTHGTIGCDGDFAAGPSATVHCYALNCSGGGYFANALTGNQNVNAGLDVVVISGTGRKPGGGAWDVPSDSRLKQHVAAYAGGLDIIRQLTPVSFNYLPATGFDPDVRHVGLIAQDVEGIMPNAVKSLAVETMPEATAAWHPESVSTFYADLREVRVTNTNEAFYAMLNAIKELDARLTAAGI
jgi:hypothetical protein